VAQPFVRCGRRVGGLRPLVRAPRVTVLGRCPVAVRFVKTSNIEMPTLASLSLPRPCNWQDFESLCCDLWRCRWGDPDTQKHGRSGQPQAGVDVFGQPNRGAEWAGVQCKLKGEGEQLTRAEIEAEVVKAAGFRPPLSQFVIATTAANDVAAQEAARLISEMQRGREAFSVSIASWDEIERHLAAYPELVAKHYPQFAIRNRGHAPPAADRYAQEPAQYVRALQARYEAANLQGLYEQVGDYVTGGVALEDIFVEPDLVCAERAPGGDEAQAASLRHARRKEGQLAQEAPRRERASWVLRREARLVLVGAPGQGKSTLQCQQLLEAARRWQERPEAEPFPVYVRLPELEAAAAGGAPDLLGFVTSVVARLGQIGPEVARQWLGGQVLWLLDGVDEVRDRHAREELRLEVKALAAQRHGDRWVVATRPAGEPLGGFAPGWRRAEMQPLDEGQVLRVLEKWAAVFEREKEWSLDARGMHHILARDRGLSRLRGNALLLTLAVLFYKSRGRLPHNRWEFYEAAEEALWGSWNRYRMVNAEAQLPGSYLPTLLDRVALMGMSSGKVAFTCEELTRECDQVLVARGYSGAERDRECRLFVRAAEDLIGVLVAQGPGLFGFLHLTLQEFLAARALRDRSAEVARHLARFWDDPDWQEVWRLYVLAVEADPSRYMEVFREVLRDPRPHSLDATLYRRQLTCLDLAGVGSGVLPREAEEVVRWGARVISEGPAALRDQVLSALGPWERSPLPAGVRAALLELAQKARLGYESVRPLWIGARDSDELRQVLLGRLADRNIEVRDVAIRALSGVSDREEVWRAVLEELSEPNLIVLQSAKAVLSMVVGEEVVQKEILARIGSERPDVRQRAADVLGGAVQAGEVRTALLGLLNDRDEQVSVRVEAARALAKAVERQDVRRELMARLDEKEADARVRAAAGQGLADAAAEEEVRQVLLARLRDRGEDGSIRAAAVQALAKAAGEEEVARALAAQLEDPDWRVFLAALDALPGAWAQAEVRRRLIWALESVDAEWWVRKSAALKLGNAVGEAEVRQVLLAGLRNGDGSVRWASARSLSAAVEEDEVRRALVEAVCDPDDTMRGNAIWALREAVGRYKKVRHAVLSRAGEDEEEAGVRAVACAALGSAGGREDVCEALLAALQDPYAEVRMAAYRSLVAGIAVERERERRAPHL
jgi:hypothetical protein